MKIEVPVKGLREGYPILQQATSVRRSMTVSLKLTVEKPLRETDSTTQKCSLVMEGKKKDLMSFFEHTFGWSRLGEFF